MRRALKLVSQGAVVSQPNTSTKRIYDKRGNTPPPAPASTATFRRSLHASIYSTQGIENDVSARLPNTTAASCVLDL